MSFLRHFPNPFLSLEYKTGDKIQIDENKIKNLILHYINKIVANTKAEVNPDKRGDIYVGDAGNFHSFLD
jgi:hypothetical protein